MEKAEPAPDTYDSTVTAANVQNGPLFIETGHEVWDKTVPLEPRYDWTNGAVALRERVLKRDGHRCVLTGLVDVRRFLETVCWFLRLLALPALLKHVSS